MAQQDHIVIFPFMAKGHTIPLLHLAAALARRRIRITLVTTPATASFIRHHLRRSPLVDVVVLHFPHHPSIPAGCESTDTLPSPDLYPSFLAATTHLRHPFDRLLLDMQSNGSIPLCVISDFFLGWTLDTCHRARVPRVVFHGMSAFSMALCKALWMHLPFKYVDGDDQPFQVPGASAKLRLTRADVPDTVRNAGDPDDPSTKFIGELASSDIKSWGIVVNSFVELDGAESVKHFESFYSVPGARAWHVGPLLLLGEEDDDHGGGDDNNNECLRWLDSKEDGSVVYVAFGTQAFVPDAQLDEVARGLEMAGCNYLWVVRSTTWAPQEGVVGDRGMVTKWAPQAAVLQHKAVGGFISHCGWNSLLESVVAGVPVLAWPMIAEQALNAKHIVDILGAGIRLRPAAADGLVLKEKISKGVKELIEGGEEGRRVREKMEKLRQMARAAVREGGSSEKELNKLIEELRRHGSSDKVAAVDHGNGMAFELQ